MVWAAWMAGWWEQRAHIATGEGDILVTRDLTKPSGQTLGAGRQDSCFPFADEKEAERLSDLPKIAVLIRSLFDSGDHALDLETSLPLCSGVQSGQWPRSQTKWGNDAPPSTAAHPHCPLGSEGDKGDLNRTPTLACTLPTQPCHRLGRSRRCYKCTHLFSPAMGCPGIALLFISSKAGISKPGSPIA